MEYNDEIRVLKPDKLDFRVKDIYKWIKTRNSGSQEVNR